MVQLSRKRMEPKQKTKIMKSKLLAVEESRNQWNPVVGIRERRNSVFVKSL